MCTLLILLDIKTYIMCTLLKLQDWTTELHVMLNCYRQGQFSKLYHNLPYNTLLGVAFLIMI